MLSNSPSSPSSAPEAQGKTSSPSKTVLALTAAALISQQVGCAVKATSIPSLNTALPENREVLTRFGLEESCTAFGDTPITVTKDPDRLVYLASPLDCGTFGKSSALLQCDDAQLNGQGEVICPDRWVTTLQSIKPHMGKVVITFSDEVVRKKASISNTAQIDK